MFDKTQIVKMKWNTSNKKRYVEKGYTFTKYYDEFEILAIDLPSNSKIEVKLKCDYCGIDYSSSFAAVSKAITNNEKNACSHCAGKKSAEKSKQRRINQYYNKAKQLCEERGYKLLLSPEEYTGVKQKVKVKTLDRIEEISIENILLGYDCFYSSYKNRNYSRLDINYINQKIEEIEGNIWLNPEEYTSCDKHNLIIKCKCGNIFKTSFVNYTRAGVIKCRKCSSKESSGEKLIRIFLTNNKISFEKEKRYDDCRDVKPLPFDFYLYDYNLIIEFDGQGHYMPMYSQQSYEDTIRHDKIKNEYCKLHNIPLLRIPYWESQNIETIIKDKLNMLKSKDIV